MKTGGTTPAPFLGMSNATNLQQTGPPKWHDNVTENPSGRTDFVLGTEVFPLEDFRVTNFSPLTRQKPRYLF